MSRRYGRNQKRRHRSELALSREEVTRLHQAHARSSALALSHAADLQEARETIAGMIRVIERVCPNSVAIPPKHRKGSERRNSIRAEVLEQLGEWSVLEADLAMTLRTVDLYALELFLRRHHEDFSTAVHLQYSGGGHSVYMISREALLAKSQDDLAKWLVPQIAKELAGHLLEGLRGGKRC